MGRLSINWGLLLICAILMYKTCDYSNIHKLLTLRKTLWYQIISQAKLGLFVLLPKISWLHDIGKTLQCYLHLFGLIFTVSIGHFRLRMTVYLLYKLLRNTFFKQVHPQTMFESIGKWGRPNMPWHLRSRCRLANINYRWLFNWLNSWIVRIFLGIKGTRPGASRSALPASLSRATTGQVRLRSLSYDGTRRPHKQGTPVKSYLLLGPLCGISLGKHGAR